MTFSLTEKQEEKLNVWLQEKESTLIELVKNGYKPLSFPYFALLLLFDKKLQISFNVFTPQDWHLLTNGGKYPYYGAIAGAVQYIFTPTSIGVAVKVKYTPTGEEINLTDYDEW